LRILLLLCTGEERGGEGGSKRQKTKDERKKAKGKRKKEKGKSEKLN
jgi:hypothetical protein